MNTILLILVPVYFLILFLRKWISSNLTYTNSTGNNEPMQFVSDSTNPIRMVHRNETFSRTGTSSKRFLTMAVNHSNRVSAMQNFTSSISPLPDAQNEFGLFR